jgi:hypothetical protein
LKTFPTDEIQDFNLQNDLSTFERPFSATIMLSKHFWVEKSKLSDFVGLENTNFHFTVE